MQHTVVLLKPDCVQKRLVGEVVRRFEREGLFVAGCKMVRFSDDLLREHYAHHTNKSFFPDLSSFMQSAPVLALVLTGPRAIAKVRNLVGPTDSRKAPPGTIRGDFGRDATVNMVHASDSPAAAATELKRFFGPAEVFLSAASRTPVVFRQALRKDR